MNQLMTDRTMHIEQLLRSRERRLLQEVQAEGSRPFQEHDNDAIKVSGDAGDESVAIMLTDVRVLETERDIAELRAIDAALTRIADGTYGACEHCSEPIDDGRLTVQPTAVRCVDCQRKHERTFWHQPTPTL